MSHDEMSSLWLMTRAKQDPCPVNFAEHFIARVMDHQQGRTHAQDIIFGGMITLIAQYYEDHEDDLETLVALSDDCQIDHALCTNRFKWFTSGGSESRFRWRVRGYEWMSLPNSPATSFTANPARPFIPERDLAATVEEIAALNSELERQRRETQQVVAREESLYGRRTRLTQAVEEERAPSPGPAQTQTPALDVEALTAQLQSMQLQLSLLQSQQQANDAAFFQRRVYDYHVGAGHIEPYLNYPLTPVQEGPVPGWQQRDGEHVPTYPYFRRDLSEPCTDYRLPGGSNPLLDPNFPVRYDYQGPSSAVPFTEPYYGMVPERFEDRFGGYPPPTLFGDSYDFGGSSAASADAEFGAPHVPQEDPSRME